MGLPTEDHVPRQTSPPLPRMVEELSTYNNDVDALGRSSFSSVRENISGLVQTFTSSKISSYSEVCEEAVVDDSREDMGEVEFLAPLTKPHSKLHGGWFPPAAPRGWKGIPVKGKSASKSYSDLQMLNRVWSKPSTIQADHHHRRGPGDSPMERLPIEVLGAIIDLLFVETPTNSTATRNADLRSLMLTSKLLYSATIATLYRHITIPHSRIFRKFLTQLSTYPSLGEIIRRLDFSHFNPGTLFSTDEERVRTQNLTEDTLLECLNLTTNLREFLAQEHISENLGPKVLKKLFTGLPNLEAVDFAGCSDSIYRASFEAILGMEWPEHLSLTRVSFHRNLILPATVFDAILPRLAHATHLDIAGCRVTDAALQSIPHTARITHLNLSKCRLLTARGVIDFISTHPAVKNTLIVLNLATDAVTHELFDEADVTELLSVLPPTLRSLSLKGSRMMSSHIPLLRPLARTLEELALGRHIDVKDINDLLAPDDDLGPHTLRYLDVSDIYGAKDLNGFFESRYMVLKDASAPLEVIEVSEKPYERFAANGRALQSAQWKLTQFGSRYWMVRDNPRLHRDDPYRLWKMGAENWGARKIPVARAEVGGMYGLFMFGRKF